MRPQPTTIWTLTASLPQLRRYCRRCATRGTFATTGRFRVNANGRRLDVWLLYACLGCDATHREAVLDRIPVREVGADRLAAFHHDDPAEVRRVAFRVQGDRVPGSVAIDGDVPEGAFAVCLVCPQPVGARLDRILARGLGLPRGEIARRVASGRIRLLGASPRALRRAARDGQWIWVGAR